MHVVPFSLHFCFSVLLSHFTEVAAASVKRLLASTVAPELLSPYTPMMGIALGVSAASGTLDGVPGTARGRQGASGGVVTRREASARARSRSKGRTVVAWKDELEAQRRGLQAGVARAVALSAAATKTVAQLSFDTSVEQDWEYVLMRQPSDDAGFTVATSSGAVQEDSGGASFGLMSSSESRVAGGKREDGPISTARRVGEKSQTLPIAAVGDADLPLEVDGEHILDLPQSWCPRLVSLLNITFYFC